uniref:Uncharacterized protein n=2 Tax=Triticum urartu TaxID=4572 RepID=A0A8R7PBN5_TRIUA
MRSCSSAGRRKAQLRCGSSPVGRRSSATPARTEYCLGYNLPRAALLYKEIDLVIRDDGGRLYDRGKVNMSPLCNKTTGSCKLCLCRACFRVRVAEMSRTSRSPMLWSWTRFLGSSLTACSSWRRLQRP